MSKKKNLTGKQFGRLTVIGPGEKTTHGQSTWICRCSCDRKITRRSDHLVPGKNQSCGECHAPRSRSVQPAGASQSPTAQSPLLPSSTPPPPALASRLIELHGAIQACESEATVPKSICQLLKTFLEVVSQLAGTQLPDLQPLPAPDVQNADPIQPSPAPPDANGHSDEALPRFTPAQLDFLSTWTRTADEHSDQPDHLHLRENGSLLPAKTASATQPLVATPPATTPLTPQKVYPIRPGHKFHSLFYYEVTEDGFDLETNLGGRPKCLGLHDTLKQVRQAIKTYLYEAGYEWWEYADLFTRSPPSTAS